MPGSDVALWDDKWLMCCQVGDVDFHRRWAMLSGDVFSIAFDQTDTDRPVFVFPLAETDVSLAEDQDLCFDVVAGDVEVRLRCADFIELNQTYEALLRAATLAASSCTMCPQLQSDVAHLQAEVAQLRDRLASAERARAQLDAALSTEQAERNAARSRAIEATTQLHEVEREAARAVAATRQVEERAEELKQRVLDNSTRAEKLEADAKTLREALAGERQRSAEYSAATSKAEAELRAVQDVLSDERRQRAAAAADAAHSTERCTSQQRELEALRAAHSETTAMIDTLSDRHNASEAERKRVAALSAEQSSELDALRERNVGLSAALEMQRAEARTMATHASDFERLNMTLSDQVELQRQRLEQALKSSEEGSRVASQQADELTELRKQLCDCERARSSAADAARRADADAKRETEDMRTRCTAEVTSLSSALHDAQELAAARAAELGSLHSKARALEEAAAAAADVAAALETEVIALRDAKARRDALNFRDSAVDAQSPTLLSQAVNTPSFSDVVRASSEVATSAAAAARRGTLHVVREIVTTLRHVSDTGAVELRPMVDALMDAVSVCATGKEVPLVEAADVGPVARATREMLDSCKARTEAAAASLGGADSVVSRATDVGVAAGFLRAVSLCDGLSDVLRKATVREAVLSFLKTEGSCARAAASNIQRSSLGRGSSKLAVLSQTVDRDYAALFDRLMHGAEQNAPNVHSAYNFSTAALQCAHLAESIRANRAIDSKDFETCVSTAMQLLTDSGDDSNEHATRLAAQLVDVYAARYFQWRQQSRRWLRHHRAAESIARFALALKRAGSILSAFKGCEEAAEECSAGWPIVEKLIELPRQMLEEDRRFGQLWQAITRPKFTPFTQCAQLL